MWGSWELKIVTDPCLFVLPHDRVLQGRVLFECCYKASAYNEGDPGSVPGSGRSPAEGNGNPLQCSCLENPMDGGTWWAIGSLWGRKESDMTERLHSLTRVSSALGFFLFSAVLLGLWTKIEPRTLAGRAQSPNHWTTKEFPNALILETSVTIPGLDPE